MSVSTEDVEVDQIRDQSHRPVGQNDVEPARVWAPEPVRVKNGLHLRKRAVLERRVERRPADVVVEAGVHGLVIARVVPGRIAVRREVLFAEEDRVGGAAGDIRDPRRAVRVDDAVEPVRVIMEPGGRVRRPPPVVVSLRQRGGPSNNWDELIWFPPTEA